MKHFKTFESYKQSEFYFYDESQNMSNNFIKDIFVKFEDKFIKIEIYKLSGFKRVLVDISLEEVLNKMKSDTKEHIGLKYVHGLEYGFRDFEKSDYLDLFTRFDGVDGNDYFIFGYLDIVYLNELMEIGFKKRLVN